MRILANIDTPDKDSLIKYTSTDLNNIEVGYLPQQFSIYPNLTVKDVIELLSSLKGINDKEYIHFLNDYFNLFEYQQVKMKNLSGGIRQRVGLFLSLLGKPQTLIIDEPTTGLDISECIKLRELIIDISQNVNIIISSHIPEDIEFICEHIWILNKGNKIYEGTISELMNHTFSFNYEATVSYNELEIFKQMGLITKFSKVNNEAIKINFISKHEINHPSVKKIPLNLVSGYMEKLNLEPYKL